MSTNLDKAMDDCLKHEIEKELVEPKGMRAYFQRHKLSESEVKTKNLKERKRQFMIKSQSNLSGFTNQFIQRLPL